MAVKRILGGKSKNLFDISKVVQSAQLKNNGNGTLTVSAYGVSAGILKDLCPNIKVGDTIEAYYTPISWTAQKPPRVMAIGKHVMDRLANHSFVVTEDDLNSKVYFYNNDYSERNLPGTTVIGNIFITNDTTVTAANYKDRYVPYELTSYKSIMKVSDVMQVVDKPVSSTGASLVGTSQTISGITCHYLEDGTGVTLTGTTSNALAIFQFGVYKKPIIGHKYLWFYQHSNASDVINKAYVELKYIDKDGKGRLFSGTEHVYTLSEYAEQFEFHPIVKDNTTCNGFTFKPQLFDLTEMFGAGNEPKTVAEFKAKFPNDYYPYSPSCFVTSFDERMPCKTKNLINSRQVYQISRDMDITIWQGEVNYVCTFSYELAMIEPNAGDAALFQFGYSDGTYSYIVSQSKYIVLSQITDSKKLTKIQLVNWSNIKGIVSNIQLEKGTTATDYVPYGYV